ncbi:MAG: GTPase ObgE [Synergistetes bacterium]|nr:GTPase ObgE [Synergistota bacterium]MCX8128441.1 GTPase ObgE [Synergistota bacterium]MDW8193138.1 GTPase ObgE [Synergistota bacterium]
MIDLVKIYVEGGKGGNGAISFRKEKYVPRGGPDGGDGGKGGDVVLLVCSSLSTLSDFRYKKHFKAEDGEHGGSGNKKGKDGEDIIIKVPPGTIVRDVETGKVMADLLVPGEKFIVAKGGRGGRGNAYFKSPTNQAPRIAEKGEKGEARWVILELKIIADVGIVGLPNVGKSTLISVLSNAKPKIANYPFTTLSPVLGAMEIENGEKIILADIPGLIEGASKGRGLGIDFLKHLERTKLLLHVVDISLPLNEIVKNFEIIIDEMRNYSSKLMYKPQIVVGNKLDLVPEEEKVRYLRSLFNEKGYEFLAISALKKEGLKELINIILRKLDEIPKEIPREKIDYIPQVKPIKVYKDGNVFIVEGDEVEHIVSTTLFESEEALMKFQKAIKKIGIEDRLKELGIKEGDIVRIGNIEFEYKEG